MSACIKRLQSDRKDQIEEMASVVTTFLSIFEKECDLLLRSCMPTGASRARRKEIKEFLADIIRKNLPEGSLFGVGSSSLSTYLPESDIDVVLLVSQYSSSSSSSSPSSSSNTQPSSYFKNRSALSIVFEALCQEISLKDDELSIHKTMTIRNIELINGRTKVAHCVVNNVPVDLTVNQTGSLATVTFLEEADRCLGHDHLLKRSIILIKV